MTSYYDLLTPTHVGVLVSPGVVVYIPLDWPDEPVTDFKFNFNN